MRLTIRVQLALAFAVPLVLLAVSTLLALAQLHAMNDSSDASTAWTTASFFAPTSFARSTQASIR